MRSSNAVVHEIKEKATQSLEAAKEKAIQSSKEAGRRIDADARKRPWFYVGFAAVFSIFFGFLLGKKSKK